jgi:hypothetical protein
LLGAKEPCPSGTWANSNELTRKVDAEYERIFRWYASRLDYRRVAWYAGKEPVRLRLGPR